MPLAKFTGLDKETILVRLDQIACAYPANLYGEGNGDEFDVATLSCTKISMINGDVLHVTESPEEIFQLTTS